ncbi:MAG: hypothetical protein ACRDOK_27670 [Streptosporangiaceae bacterium]
MNDMGLESPDADSAEQKQDAVVEPGGDDEVAGLAESPLEANEADAAEQKRILDTGEEEYR